MKITHALFTAFIAGLLLLVFMSAWQRRPLRRVKALRPHSPSAAGRSSQPRPQDTRDEAIARVWFPHLAGIECRTR